MPNPEELLCFPVRVTRERGQLTLTEALVHYYTSPEGGSLSYPAVADLLGMQSREQVYKTRKRALAKLA